MSGDYRYEVGDEQRQREAGDPGQFDRVAFAMAALRVLRPKMDVAVYSRGRRFSVERGRDLRRGFDAIWAMVGIPRDASRESIARTLAELSGDVAAPLLVEEIVSRLRALDPLDMDASEPPRSGTRLAVARPLGDPNLRR